MLITTPQTLHKILYCKSIKRTCIFSRLIYHANLWRHCTFDAHDILLAYTAVPNITVHWVNRTFLEEDRKLLQIDGTQESCRRHTEIGAVSLPASRRRVYISEVGPNRGHKFLTLTCSGSLQKLNQLFFSSTVCPSSKFQQNSPVALWVLLLKSSHSNTGQKLSLWTCPGKNTIAWVSEQVLKVALDTQAGHFGTKCKRLPSNDSWCQCIEPHAFWLLLYYDLLPARAMSSEDHCRLLRQRDQRSNSRSSERDERALDLRSRQQRLSDCTVLVRII